MRTVTSSQGITISLGENAGENDALRKRARQNDLWLHVDGMPSTHAVVHVSDAQGGGSSGGGGSGRRAKKAKSDGEVGDSIHEAAQLVKHFTPDARAMRAVSVLVVEAKFVSSAPGGKAGSVVLKKTPRTRSVVADEPVLQDLLGRLQRS